MLLRPVIALFVTALSQVAIPAAADAGTLHGRALFDGTAALHGRIAGHQDALPSAVLVCANCHGIADDGGERPAPRLDGGWLAEARSRRNGPSAAYDAQSFCAALRTGVDPVQVRLPTRMPRFEMSDSDCNALWNYLAIPVAAKP